MLSVEGVTKQYPAPRGSLAVLAGVSFTLSPGEALAIMGPSGSGKSTLLYIVGTLEPPTAGRIMLGGTEPALLDDAALARFRNRHVGFVFQDHCLLPQCSLLENVLVPTLVAAERGAYEARARELLDAVGLGDRSDHLPGQLSGGEKQRAALARALVMQPDLLLCDEPTGNLDRHAAELVASLLLELHERRRTMLVVVTHSPGLAARFPTRRLLDGRLDPV